MALRTPTITSLAGVVSVLLLAGCGGGPAPSSGSATPAPTVTSAAPTSYTTAQLRSALPAVQDIPGAAALLLSCPGDGQECDPYPEGTAVVQASIEPASPKGAARVQDQQTPLDFVAVHGTPHASSADVTKALRQTRDGQRKYQDDYAVKLDDGRTMRGTGSTATLTIGVWNGVKTQRTEKYRPSKDDKGLLVATAWVAHGRTSANAFVSLSAAGRDPSAAADLAEQLVRNYVKKLV